jgi:hypothetical protein
MFFIALPLQARWKMQAARAVRVAASAVPVMEDGIPSHVPQIDLHTQHPGLIDGREKACERRLRTGFVADFLKDGQT